APFSKLGHQHKYSNGRDRDGLLRSSAPRTFELGVRTSLSPAQDRHHSAAWMEALGLTSSTVSHYPKMSAMVKMPAPIERRASGWRLGAQRRVAAIDSAVPHARNPSARRMATAPAKMRPEAMGASPVSATLCQVRPRQRSQRRAAP